MDFGKLSDRIRRRMAVARVPNLALAVVRDGEVVFSEGYGVTSVEDERPITPETLFRIGSTTKPMVGVCVMRLVERGLLELDTPVKRYVPWLKLSDHGAANQITLRMLLSHTTGLPTEFRAVGPHNPAALEASLREELPHYKIFTPPGLLWSYSNPGIRLAAHIAERAYGKLFPEMLREVIFDPLEMNWSTCDPLEAMMHPLALPHCIVKSDQANKGTLQVEERFANNAARLPAGGVISNVLEVARFAQMLLGRGSWNGRTILRPQSVDELCRPQVRKYTPENDFYGLTTESAKRIGPGWIGHNGYSPPYRSRFIVNIEHGAAVSILFSDGEDFSIQGRALEKHIGRRLVPVEREDAANTKESGKESFDWSQFAGRFVGRDGTAAFIELSGDGAALRYDGDDYSLQVVGDDIFLCTEIGGRKRQILGLPPIAGHLGRYITINSSPFRQQGYFEEKWQSLVARVEQFQARFKS